MYSNCAHDVMLSALGGGAWLALLAEAVTGLFTIEAQRAQNFA